MRKPKTSQPETPDIVQDRDFFQTPNYATDLLAPYLPKVKIWECASGHGKIVKRLESYGFDVFGTDLLDGTNFLTDDPPHDFDCIVTNTPFSIKSKFFKRCMEYGLPFALLIPADYSGWLIDAVRLHGCEKIIPTRRIDFITPHILDILCRNASFSKLPDKEKQFYKNKPKNLPRYLWDESFMYPSLEACPKEMMQFFPTSQFHSMWLTRGLHLGRSETFVELTKQMKENI